MKILARYVLAVMGCLGFMNLLLCRLNISVAIVAMVGVSKPEVIPNGNAHNDLEELEYCMDNSYVDLNGSFHQSTQLKVNSKGDFDWSPKAQGFLIGAYYYGYASCQVMAFVIGFTALVK